jgi:SAM-dependent methyltransferase
MKEYLSNDFNLLAYAGFADECSIWSAPFGLKLLDYIEYKPGITALDIGFGTGFPLTEVALRLGASSIVYGIDPWKEAIARAKQKIEFYRIRNIRIIEGVAESIPLDDNSVHLIVSNNGLNNVIGQFVMTMNTHLTMFEFYGELEKVLSELNMTGEIEMMHRHIYEKRRPVNEMIRMVLDHGFMIKNADHDQFNYRFSNGSAMLNHYFIRLAFMDSWIKIMPEDRREQIFDIIETRLNEKAGLSGGIKLSVPFVIINAITPLV